MATKQWKVGDKVICNGYPGVIKKIHKDEPNQKVQLTGMVDVDLARGGVTVDLKDLDRENGVKESFIRAVRSNHEVTAKKLFGRMMQETVNRALNQIRSTSLLEHGPAKCKDCGKKFTPTYGEFARCPDCLSQQHANAERGMTEEIVKKALIREPGAPVGQSAPMHLICICGHKVYISFSLQSYKNVCDNCGREWDSKGYLKEATDFDYDYLKKVNGEYWHKSSKPGVCDECDKKKSPLWKVMANTTPEGDTVYVRNCEDCLRDAFGINWKSPTFTGKKLNESSDSGDGKWHVRMDLKRSTWYWFVTNPQGGGHGSTDATSKKVAFHKATRYLEPGTEYELILNGKSTWETKA